MTSVNKSCAAIRKFAHLDTLNGGGGGLGNSLQETITLRQAERIGQHVKRTADTPPIMKSTIYGCQVSNQFSIPNPQAGSMDATKA